MSRVCCQSVSPLPAASGTLEESHERPIVSSQLSAQKPSLRLLSSPWLRQANLPQSTSQPIVTMRTRRTRRKTALCTKANYGATNERSGAWTSRPGARYERVGGCLVFPALPRSRKAKGIVIFLGGAFIGAAPDVTYSYFIELLAKEGFVIVATPYNVTFDHAVSAENIHRKFSDTFSVLSNTGCSFAGLSPEEIEKLPVYSVGHSNGALMQLLIGSLCTDGQLPKANAIISFNNKPAADAVPFFDQMGPAMQQAAPILQASPLTNMAASFAAEAIKAVKTTSIPLPPGVGKEDLQSLQQFFEQIPGVLDQVSEGVSEFTPTPAENQITIATKYAIPHNLLIKFTDDSIDESDLLEEPLRIRSNLLGGSFKKLVLTGTHATPLAQDLRWEVGSVYTPVDAVGQVVKYAALADLRSLAKSIGDWFDTIY